MEREKVQFSTPMDWDVNENSKPLVSLLQAQILSEKEQKAKGPSRFAFMSSRVALYSSKEIAIFFVKEIIEACSIF